MGDRLGFVDAIRALAALFVVLHHAWLTPSNGYFRSSLLNHLGLAYGQLAVAVFIVVSGFCLTLPVARRGDRLGSVTGFLRRRARRILPPYYAALALSVVFIVLVGGQRTGNIWDTSLPLTWGSVLTHALLVNDLPLHVPGGGIDYPLWSIALEFQIYLFMPLVVLSIRRLGAMPTVAWTLGFGAALHLATHGGLDGARPWYLGLFALGAVAARGALHQRGEIAAAWRWAAVATWAALVAAMVLLHRGFYDSHGPLYDVAAGAATALTLFVVMAEARPGPLTRWLSWRPLVGLGVFSYSLYLVHAPALQAEYLLLRRLPLHSPEAMFAALVLVGVPVATGVAYLFHVVFERPFMTHGRAVPSVRLSRAAAPQSAG